MYVLRYRCDFDVASLDDRLRLQHLAAAGRTSEIGLVRSAESVSASRRSRAESRQYRERRGASRERYSRQRRQCTFQGDSIQATPELINDPAAFQKWQAAQGELSSALSRLMVVVERYPDLKSISGFQDLRAQLEGTENRITVARKRYIDSVQAYNVTVRQFPTNLTAKMFGHNVKPNFTVENEAQISRPPTVDFGTASTDRSQRQAPSRSKRIANQRTADLRMAARDACFVRASEFTGVRWRSRCSLSLLLWCITGVSGAQVAVPELRSPVTDLTSTLTPEQVTALDQKLRAFEQRKGSQLAVLIVPTTQPEAIEQFSIRVVEAWKLGRRGVDDGVLLLVAKDDRAVRIEVAYGLEGALPDVIADRIVEQVVVPRFRNGQFYEGINEAVDRIIGVLDGERCRSRRSARVHDPAKGWAMCCRCC